jgi:hypothetical protein
MVTAVLSVRPLGMKRVRDSAHYHTHQHGIVEEERPDGPSRSVTSLVSPSPLLPNLSRPDGRFGPRMCFLLVITLQGGWGQSTDILHCGYLAIQIHGPPDNVKCQAGTLPSAASRRTFHFRKVFRRTTDGDYHTHKFAGPGQWPLGAFDTTEQTPSEMFPGIAPGSVKVNTRRVVP